MSDTVFRTKVETKPGPAPSGQKAPADKGVPRGVDTLVEPPFTDYQTLKGKPFVVDHYELGDRWDQGDMYSRGYTEEVSDINKYLKYSIDQGEINNTTKSVKNELKRIEKMVNVKPDARKFERLSLVSEYAKFLLKSFNIKKESAKYGMI